MSVSINIQVATTIDKLHDQINACFEAKNHVSVEVENHLDEVIDILDDMMVKVSNAEDMRDEA